MCFSPIFVVPAPRLGTKHTRVRENHTSDTWGKPQKAPRQHETCPDPISRNGRLTAMPTNTNRLDAALSTAVTNGDLKAVAAAAWSSGRLDYEAAFGESNPGVAMRPDSMLWIASLTKAVTAAAVMQLVERKVIELDKPAGELVPYLRDVEVLDGFDNDGNPRLRKPAGPITLRHLLTHTSGFGYDWADPDLARYSTTQPTPPAGSVASYERPLIFDPGDRWAYGSGIDWAGRVLEAATGEALDDYTRENITTPLGMLDTTFTLSAAQRQRMTAMHRRSSNGLVPMAFERPEKPEMMPGGSGLCSTVHDYLRFARMILGSGELEGAKVLRPETVDAMCTDQLGALTAPGWQTQNAGFSNDVALFPGQSTGWGLSFLINRQTSPQGRSAGSVAWAGLANSYYWIDRVKGVAGVFSTQVLPFFDAVALDTFAAFESAAYASIA